MTQSVSQSILGFIILSVLAVGVKSSEGDADYVFQSCVMQCSRSCHESTISGLLKIMAWDCQTNCQYTCMREITQVRKDQGMHVTKYYGKWPFLRVFGMQELFSVIFSIANAIPHMIYLRIYLQKIPKTYQRRRLWAFYGVLAINTWLWSAVFHARDTPLTEKLDYFCAQLLGFYNASVAIIRIFGPRYQTPTLLTFGLGYLLHIGYMTLVRFDYGWNMKVFAAIGFSSAMLWTGWAVKSAFFSSSSSSSSLSSASASLSSSDTFHQRRTYVWKIVGVSLGTALASAFELLDFPPYADLIDAHAVWHGLTIPFGFLFWSFISDDSLYEMVQYDPFSIAKRR